MATTKGKHENNQITILALITKRNRSEKGKEMNANELSDELQDLYKNYCHANAIKEAATMLRQLQAEISVSENLVKHLHSENKQLRNENKELQAENQFFKDVMGDVEILRKAQEK